MKGVVHDYSLSLLVVWCVDGHVPQRMPVVEVLRHEKNSLWTFHTFGPDDDVELTSLQLRFSVTAVYENVIFPSE